MSSPRDDKNRTQIPWLPSLCFPLIVFLSTLPRTSSVKGWRGSGHKCTKSARWRLHCQSSGITLWHFPLFWQRKMKAAAATNPWDQELDLGTACCGYSFFFIFGLSFLTSPFRAALTSSSSHLVSVFLSALLCTLLPGVPLHSPSTWPCAQSLGGVFWGFLKAEAFLLGNEC